MSPVVRLFEASVSSRSAVFVVDIVMQEELHQLTAKGDFTMLKKVAFGLFVVALVFSLSVAGFTQGGAKEERVEGKVLRSNKDKSTLTVAGVMGNKTVHYDASTQWDSQYHGDKKATAIEASQVKDGDYVICVGSNNDKGEFHATRISKRLSHSE